MRVYKEQVCSSVQISATTREVPTELRSIKFTLGICLQYIVEVEFEGYPRQRYHYVLCMTLNIAHTKN